MSIVFNRTRTVLGTVLLTASMLILNGCGGSGNGGGGTTPPPVTPTVSITVPSPTMTAGATQTITATVSNPNVAVACSSFMASEGTLATPTLSGNSCFALYTAPTTITTVTTVTFTFTGGGASGTNSTSVSPVAQTVSLASTANVVMNGSFAASTVTTASASCPQSALSYTIVPVDGNTTVFGTSKLAYFDPTTGNINGGNALTSANGNTFNVNAKCGSVTSNTMVLTVIDPAPTLTGCTPATLPPSGGNITCNGSGFSSNNSSTSPSQWQGTEADSNLGACPSPTPTTGYSGTAWNSGSQFVWGFHGSNGTLGPYCLRAINYATASGTGGGAASLTAGYTITATGMFKTATGDLAVSYDPETGALNLNQNGTVTAFNLAPKASTMLVTADAVYVPQPASIAKIDLAARTLSSIPISGYVPASLVEGSAGNVYASATLFADSMQGAILRISSQGVVSKVTAADGITSLASSGSRLVWTADSSVGKVSTVHVFDTNLEAEAAAFTISRQADKVMPLSGGHYALVFQGGSKEASVLDMDSLKESGSVPFAAGILGFNGDRASLLDGTIGNVGIALDGSGNPKLSWSIYSKQPVEDLYDGFAVSTAKDGTDSLLVAHRIASGKLLPQARTVPNQQ